MTRRLTILLALALAPAALGAQTPSPTPPVSAPDGWPTAFEDLLFPPELVMQHQRELALTAQQRAAITEAVKSLQGQVVDIQWQMQEEQQKLVELLSQPQVQEAGALTQIDRVLDLERQIKKAHLASLIRIRNALTAEQQQQLRESRGVKWGR